MGGTLLNIVTVLLGSTIGLLIGNRLPDRIQTSVVTGLGLVTLVVGFQNANQTGNIIIILLATVIGVIIGELLNIDGALEGFAGWLQAKVGDGDSQVSSRERFITGFVTASLVFCVGPLTFVGAIQDGMGLASGFEFLAIKSVLDLFAAMAFAASFGVGVVFTTLTILVVQGGLALLGSLLVSGLADPTATDALMTNPIILEMTAVGGILLIALSLILMDIKRPRVANFLPALIIAPLLVVIGQALGIAIYPFG